MSFNGITQLKAEAGLIARAKVGDEQAFEALFRAYGPRVYSLCVRMTGDLNEAEDLAQETFLQLFRKISTFRNESAFGTWLHRVTVNVVLMHLRRKRIQFVPFEQADLSRQESGWQEFGAEDRRLAEVIDHLLIRRALGRLPTGRRAILVLHDVEGYRHGEIADLLDCSVGNSKSQLSRARWSMRKLLFSPRKNRSKSESSLKKTRGHPAGHPVNGGIGMTANGFGVTAWGELQPSSG